MSVARITTLHLLLLPQHSGCLLSLWWDQLISPTVCSPLSSRVYCSAGKSWWVMTWDFVNFIYEIANMPLLSTIPDKKKTEKQSTKFRPQCHSITIDFFYTISFIESRKTFKAIFFFSFKVFVECETFKYISTSVFRSSRSYCNLPKRIMTNVPSKVLCKAWTTHKLWPI